MALQIARMGSWVESSSLRVPRPNPGAGHDHRLELSGLQEGVRARRGAGGEEVPLQGVRRGVPHPRADGAGDRAGRIPSACAAPPSAQPSWIATPVAELLDGDPVVGRTPRPPCTPRPGRRGRRRCRPRSRARSPPPRARSSTTSRRRRGCPISPPAGRPGAGPRIPSSGSPRSAGSFCLRSYWPSVCTSISPRSRRTSRGLRQIFMICTGDLDCHHRPS